MSDRATFFGSAGYATADTAAGVVHGPGNERLVLLSREFIRGFRAAVIEECGPAAEIVFRSCGLKWGRHFAPRFETELAGHMGHGVTELPLVEFDAQLADAFVYNGWGRLSLDWSRHEQGIIQATLRDSFLVEVSTPTDNPVDALFGGIVAGVVGHFAGQELDAFETQCAALGAPECKFVIVLASRLKALGMKPIGMSHGQLVEKLAETRA